MSQARHRGLPTALTEPSRALESTRANGPVERKAEAG